MTGDYWFHLKCRAIESTLGTKFKVTPLFTINSFEKIVKYIVIAKVW